MEKLVLENLYKIVVLLFGAAYQHMLHQIKAQQFYTALYPYQQCWVLQKIVQFKDFEWFSSAFQGRFNLQGLFKQAL